MAWRGTVLVPSGESGGGRALGNAVSLPSPCCPGQVELPEIAEVHGETSTLWGCGGRRGGGS